MPYTGRCLSWEDVIGNVVYELVIGKVGQLWGLFLVFFATECQQAECLFADLSSLRTDPASTVPGRLRDLMPSRQPQKMSNMGKFNSASTVENHSPDRMIWRV